MYIYKYFIEISFLMAFLISKCFNIRGDTILIKEFPTFVIPREFLLSSKKLVKIGNTLITPLNLIFKFY